jgi:hypothetical protein
MVEAQPEGSILSTSRIRRRVTWPASRITSFAVRLEYVAFNAENFFPG